MGAVPRMESRSRSSSSQLGASPEASSVTSTGNPSGTRFKAGKGNSNGSAGGEWWVTRSDCHCTLWGDGFDSGCSSTVRLGSRHHQYAVKSTATLKSTKATLLILRSRSGGCEKTDAIKLYSATLAHLTKCTSTASLANAATISSVT